MPTEKDYEIETRLAALEFMVAQLFRIHYDQLDFTDEQVADQRERMRRFSGHLTVEGAKDAAMADYMSAEIAGHVDSILELVDHYRKALRRD